MLSVAIFTSSDTKGSAETDDGAEEDTLIASLLDEFAITFPKLMAGELGDSSIEGTTATYLTRVEA